MGKAEVVLSAKVCFSFIWGELLCLQTFLYQTLLPKASYSPSPGIVDYLLVVNVLFGYGAQDLELGSISVSISISAN